MAEDKADDLESGIDDFLIVEYQHFADSFWRNEELGEKRLNFFMSLLTAAIAGIALLATSDKGFTDSQLQWLTFSVELALLLFGVSTLPPDAPEKRSRRRVQAQHGSCSEAVHEPLQAQGLRALSDKAPSE